MIADDLSLSLLVAAVVDEVMAEAAMWAYKRSSGPLTFEDRAALGFPYSRRHGSPQRDPGELNYDPNSTAAEEGRPHFRDSWKLGDTVVSGTKITGHLTNDNPIADAVVQGNARTFGRPIDVEVQEWAETEIERRLRQLME